MSTPNTKKALTPTLSQRARELTAFTLVELIVVITILVILGTIAFINLGGFSGSARDSARISNLANLQKGLNVYQVRTGTYPTPESSVAITASGTTIGYQGFAKDIVGGIAKISKGGTVDPSDSNIYTTYAVNQTLTKMQAMVFLEDSGNVTAFNLPLPLGEGWGEGFVAYAATTTDYSKRYPKTLGDGLGIILGNSGITLNQPVQENTTIIASGSLDIMRTPNMYKAVFSKTDSISGSGTGLQSLQISYVNGAGLNSPSTCPTGFIAVPGNSEFNQPGFCVAKYEMSYGDADTPNTCDGTCPVAENTVNQTDWNTIAYVAGKIPVSTLGKFPIAKITQSEAIAACQSIGVGYHLITNNEWMTIARNIEAQSINWSSGTVGGGYISNGVSNDTNIGCGDTNTKTQYSSLTRIWATKTGEGFGNTNCDTKRQLKLSNGQIIWDLAGNVWEHVNKANMLDGTGYATGTTDNTGCIINGAELNTCTDKTFMSKNTNFTSANGIGSIYGARVTDNIFLRGGRAVSGMLAGVFTLDLRQSSVNAYRDVGFRCAR